MSSSVNKFMGPYKEASLYLFRSVTPIHVGSGRGGELVDLPIQRDSMNLPIIFASSIKGALRSIFENKDFEEDLFGPKPEATSQFAGAAAFLDARILMFPVRSLKNLYCYVLSPISLRYLLEYLVIVSSFSNKTDINTYIESVKILITKAKNLGSNEILLSKDAKDFLMLSDLGIILNETFIYKEPNSIKLLDNAGENALKEIYKLLKLEKIDNQIIKRIVIVHDEQFKELLERSIIRQIRIRLKPETKTVERGALWSEEYLPRDSFLIWGCLFSDSKKSDNVKASDLKKTFETELFTNRDVGYIILGGEVTIGKGVLEVFKIP